MLPDRFSLKLSKQCFEATGLKTCRFIGIPFLDCALDGVSHSRTVVLPGLHWWTQGMCSEDVL